MSREEEAFLSRWSRLKSEARNAPAEEPAAAPPAPPAPAEPASAPALPPVETLTPESDFAPFMSPKIDPATRREALKKLFADAHFNVPDPFEAYSEDYTKGETLPLEALKRLNQARRLLFDDAGRKTETAQAPAGGTEQPGVATGDGAGKQDA